MSTNKEKPRRNLTLSDEEWEALGRIAQQQGTSRSALVGQWALGKISVHPDHRLIKKA